jgi:hypothetical protein
LHNPIFKRGKAKKFSYQYQGPYEVELKISPLIYTLRTKEGTSIIVHINRLKRAYCKQLREQKVGVKLRKQKSRRRESKEEPSALELCEDELDASIPSNKTRLGRQIENTEIESSDESEREEMLETNFPSPERKTQEWMPNSRYLQRKLLTETATSDNTYQLRSRTVRRQEPETEVDKIATPEVEEEMIVERQP